MAKRIKKNKSKTPKKDYTSKNFSFILVATGVLLLIPLVAMYITPQVYWTLSDFIVMGILLSGTGFAYEFLTNKFKKINKFIIGTTLLILFLSIWVQLSVGIFGD